ncbi:MAG: hypothetical protein KBC17_00440 [Candidatus Pacebacteria bacterium]|nr:hypothetical protein [Candidatus Paceibacterota bacterium]
MISIILIIEDFEDEKNSYVKNIPENKIKVLWGYSLEKAQELFNTNPDIDVIIIDGCVNNFKELDTLPLIEKIRRTYKGPMIAASRSDTYRKRMVAAGCDKETWKENVNNLLRGMLGI